MVHTLFHKLIFPTKKIDKTVKKSLSQSKCTCGRAQVKSLACKVDALIEVEDLIYLWYSEYISLNTDTSHMNYRVLGYFSNTNTSLLQTPL